MQICDRIGTIIEENWGLNGNDWEKVVLFRRTSTGQFLCFEKNGEPIPYAYIKEKSTGDLYLARSPGHVSERCFALLLGTPIYLGAMVTVRLLKVVVDVTKIASAFFKQAKPIYQEKGAFALCGRAFMTLTVEIPLTVAEDLARVAMCPFYAIGLTFAALYGMISPFEGRVWFAKIEGRWHGTQDYRADLRYTKNPEDNGPETFKEFFNELEKGKVFYLAWCMQRRGNIHDKAQNGLNRFQPRSV